MSEQVEMTELEILQCARDLLAKPGVWIKGSFYFPPNEGFPEGQCCAVGAVRKCAGWYEKPPSLFGPLWSQKYIKTKSVIELLKRALPPPRRISALEISNFNDAPQRTLPQILALFDRAILAASTSTSPAVPPATAE